MLLRPGISSLVDPQLVFLFLPSVFLFLIFFVAGGRGGSRKLEGSKGGEFDSLSWKSRTSFVCSTCWEKVSSWAWRPSEYWLQSDRSIAWVFPKSRKRKDP